MALNFVLLVDVPVVCFAWHQTRLVECCYSVLYLSKGYPTCGRFMNCLCNFVTTNFGMIRSFKSSSSIIIRLKSISNCVHRAQSSRRLAWCLPTKQIQLTLFEVTNVKKVMDNIHDNANFNMMVTVLSL